MSKDFACLSGRKDAFGAFCDFNILSLLLWLHFLSVKTHTIFIFTRNIIFIYGQLNFLYTITCNFILQWEFHDLIKELGKTEMIRALFGALMYGTYNKS